MCISTCISLHVHVCFQASEAQQLRKQSAPAEPNKATDGVYIHVCTMYNVLTHLAQYCIIVQSALTIYSYTCTWFLSIACAIHMHVCILYSAYISWVFISQISRILNCSQKYSSENFAGVA